MTGLSMDWAWLHSSPDIVLVDRPELLSWGGAYSNGQFLYIESPTKKKKEKKRGATMDEPEI